MVLTKVFRTAFCRVPMDGCFCRDGLQFIKNCVTTLHKRSLYSQFFGMYVPAFNCMRTRKTTKMDTFYVVWLERNDLIRDFFLIIKTVFAEKMTE